MSEAAKPRHKDDVAPASLAKRLRHLEDQMDTVIDAVEEMARSLEEGPMAEPDGEGVERAARRAHELLLLAKSPAAEGPDKP